MSDEPDYPAIVYHTAKTGLGAGYDKGYAEGVKDAREAVAAQDHRWSVDYTDAIRDALAAIDALEKP